MIVGAQKAGTTSLKEYLGKHPNVATHIQTELTFFADENEYKVGFEKQLNTYFPAYDSKAKMIAKHATLYTDKKSLQRLYEHNLACTLVLVIRNPIERAYSAYTMGVNNGWLNRNFDEIVGVLQKKDYQDLMYRHFVDLGNYAKYLNIIYSIFPKEQVHIVLFEDLKNDAKQVCESLFAKLNLPVKADIDYETAHNETKKVRSQALGRLLLAVRQNNNILKRIGKAVLPYQVFTRVSQALLRMNKSQEAYNGMAVATKQALKEYYQPYNYQIQQMTGISVEQWNQ